MFNEQELLYYDEQFKKVGITEKEEQVKVLDFLYTLGIIINKLQGDEQKKEEGEDCGVLQTGTQSGSSMDEGQYRKARA